MEEQIAVIKNEIQALSEGADMLECNSRQDYEILVRQEDAAVAIKKQVEDYFNPDIKKAHELHKSLTLKRKTLLDPIEAFISSVKRVGGAFLALEQKREQDRLDALRREAEAIRARQEAELARQAAELRAKQEAERKAQELAFKNSPAELAKAKARMEAEQAEARRRMEEEAKARMVDTAALPVTVDKVSAGEGRTTVQTWTYRVVDEALVPRQYLILDTKAIGAVITALKDKACIPGIEAVMETSVRRTGRGV
jgi:hypothetical protein